VVKVIENKATLRQRLRRLRPAVAPAYPALIARLAAWPTFQAAHCVLAFAPLPGEPDITPLVAQYPQKQWAFPRVEGEALRFYDAEMADLAPGTYGIPEPAATARPLEARPDLILVPAMAADHRGQRLGYGKGFYDRFLAQFAGVTTVCLVPEAFWVAQLPTERWDVPVTVVLTERRTVVCCG
jgi:5-formyltetrahydrofolate cyclo-ligase